MPSREMSKVQFSRAASFDSGHEVLIPRRQYLAQTPADGARGAATVERRISYGIGGIGNIRKSSAVCIFCIPYHSDYDAEKEAELVHVICIFNNNADNLLSRPAIRNHSRT